MANISKIETPDGTTYELAPKEENIKWGGDNVIGSVSPIGMSLSADHSANRIAFINGDLLSVEGSSDNGNTWTDYGLTKGEKTSFCTSSKNIHIGTANPAEACTLNSKLRITLTAQDGTNPSNRVYTNPKKLLVNVSSANGLEVLIEVRTGTNYLNNGAWKTWGTYTVSGWSGWNDIPLIMWSLGGDSTQTSNYWQLRLTFSVTSLNSSEQSRSSCYVYAIRIYGDNAWTTPSNMARHNHIYDYDYNQNTTFPANVTAPKFIGALQGNADTATSATSATTASKLGSSNVGSATQPIYLNGGTPTATTYTLGKSVPSDAVFTDHYAWSDITGKPSSYIPASHTHGNIQNGGTLQTSDITIASGDKLVVTDSSDSSKVARTSVSFDGSTTTKCLTQKGTWESFTNNTGTVTSVKVGTTSYNPSSGVVSLPAYPTTLPASDVSDWAKASTKPTYTASEVGAIATTAKGVASGVAELDANGKVPASQLPSYVDDVLEYTSKSSFPTTGETGKIYVDTTTNLTYRWSGTAYVEISPSLALGETDSTAYYGNKGKIAYDHSQSTHARTDATAVTSSSTNGNIKINGTETTVYTHPGSGTNPHGTTASDVGLGNVGNFKAVSTVASQGLTSTEQSNARANIGAGTSNFSGSYTDLSNKPTLGTAAAKDSTTSVTSGSNDLVTSGAVYSAIQGASGTTYTFAEGTTNGAFSVTPSGGTAQSVPVHGVLTSHQSVTDNNPTLSWGSKSKVATIGSTEINVTMPSNPASGKQDTITGAATTVTSSNLTASRVLISNTSGKISAASGVTTTEVGYLAGLDRSVLGFYSHKSYDTSISVDDMRGISGQYEYNGSYWMKRTEWADMPGSNTYGYLEVMGNFQRFTNYSSSGSGVAYLRMYANSEWSPWTQIKDTTYESKTASSGGTAVSLCTTGEKYTWNSKVSASVSGTVLTLS